MSEGLNRVFLLGHVGADPELRFTQGGTAVLNMRMATNETFVDRNKEAQERTDWHQVVVWGPRAEGLSKLLTRGSLVLVEGGLRTSSYEKDGQKRYKTEVHAREVSLPGRRPPPAPSSAAMEDEEPLGRESPQSASRGSGGGGGRRSVAARRAVARAPGREESPPEELPY